MTDPRLGHITAHTGGVVKSVKYCYSCHDTHEKTCYEYARRQYMQLLASEDEEAVAAALRRMLQCVTATVPNMDDITAEPWPGDKLKPAPSNARAATGTPPILAAMVFWTLGTCASVLTVFPIWLIMPLFTAAVLCTGIGALRVGRGQARAE